MAHAIAQLLSISVCVVGAVAASLDLRGGDYLSGDLDRYEVYRKIFFVNLLVCHFVFGLVKISVLLFYKRIFDTPRFRMLANTLMIITMAWMLATLAALLLAATPISRFWTTSPTEKHTIMKIKLAAFVAATAGIDLSLDIIIIALPLPQIRGLHIDRRKKIAISAVFLLGALCTVTTCVRLYFAILLTRKKNKSGVTSTWLSDFSDMFIHIEASLCVLTACLPTLSPLFKAVAKLPGWREKAQALFWFGAFNASPDVQETPKSLESGTTNSRNGSILTAGNRVGVHAYQCERDSRGNVTLYPQLPQQN